MLGVWEDAGQNSEGDISEARIYRKVFLEAGKYFFGANFNNNWNMSDNAYIYATTENVATEEIPSKAIAYVRINEARTGERPNVIRVPLNSRAKALIDKYKDRDDLNGKLFPFISSQEYNVAIKKIFKTCGVNRMVTVLNPTTGKEEKRPLDEIASSHLARRIFIGNLYNKVKDPNLVGSLSGHIEGSRAFARYRTIDDDMKKELVDLLD